MCLRSYSEELFINKLMLIWKDLKEKFDEVSGSRIFTIYREIASPTQESSTIFYVSLNSSFF